MSENTQTGIKLVVLDFGFVCDELVRYRLCYNRFGVISFIVSITRTYYILSDTYITYYIILGLYVRVVSLIFSDIKLPEGLKKGSEYCNNFFQD